MHASKLVFAAAALMASAAAVGIASSPAQAQGFRAEIHGGWDRLSNEDVRDNGITYGAGVGYDVALGSGITAGVEGNLDFSNSKECETGVLGAGDELCLRAKRDLSAVVRLGFDVARRSKIYALAGYTNGRFRINYTPATGAATRESENLDGLRLGAGFQQSFGNGIYSKIEYRYSNYEAGAERHQVLAGLGIAF